MYVFVIFVEKFSKPPHMLPPRAAKG